MARLELTILYYTLSSALLLLSQVKYLKCRLHKHKDIETREDGREKKVMDRVSSFEISNNIVVVLANWEVDNVITIINIVKNVLGSVNNLHCAVYEIL